MTKFSAEYIAYILSDEASVLQEHWKKRGVHKGDWVWDAGRKKGNIRLVTSITTHTDSLDFVLDGIAKRWTAEVDWFPTLSDLLGMIEEAGWAWGRNTDGKWYTWPVDSARIGYRARSKRDHLLAAAKLAVRVLERKDANRNTT